MTMKTKRKFILFSLIIFLVMFTNASIITVSLGYGFHLTQATAIDKSSIFFPFAVALCVMVSGAASAYAIARVGTAAISASVESEKSFTISLLIVSMAEAIAIYGLIVALLLLIL